MDLSDYELEEITLKQTKQQLKWVDGMIERYHKATGKTITRAEVLSRVLYHGFAGAESEMTAIEQGFFGEKPPKEPKKR